MITTNHFFAKAYAREGGRASLTPRDLLATADSLYIVWRNQKVQQWSTAVFQKHGLKLLDYQDRLLDMMDATDQDYYNSMATCDLWGTDEEIALCLAQAVAVLRWWHNVYAGRVSERFPSSLKQAELWLEMHKAIPVPKKSGQLSLFLGG